MKNIFLTQDEAPTNEYFDALQDWLGPEKVDWAKYNPGGVTNEAVRKMHERARKQLGQNERKHFNGTPLPNLFPIDQDKFDITMVRAGMWGKMDDPQYSFFASGKPRDNSIAIEQIEEIMKSEPKEWEIEPIFYPGGRVMQIVITDAHVGNGYIDIRDTLIKLAVRATELSEGVTSIVITFLGDILHYNDSKRQTVKGTQLESSGETPYEMMESAFGNFCSFIKRMHKITPWNVRVYTVLGNHSDLLEYALFRMLEERIPEVDFYISQTKYNAVVFYDTLVGLTHGDQAKKEVGRWLAREYPELWGSAKNWEVHAGHEHSYRIDNTGVCPVIYYPSLSPNDEWSTNEQGYTGNEQSAFINVWSANGKDVYQLKL